MSNDALLDAVTRRWQMLQNQWALYLVVSAAVLAFVVALPGLRTDRRALRLIALCYAFFAWTHLLGLLYIVKQWALLAGELARHSDAAARERFLYAGIFDAPATFWVVPFHLIGDALVLAGIWWVSRATAVAQRVPPGGQLAPLR